MVQNVTRHGVFFSLMRSPIGWKAFYYCNRCDVRSLAISEINSAYFTRMFMLE